MVACHRMAIRLGLIGDTQGRYSERGRADLDKVLFA